MPIRVAQTVGSVDYGVRAYDYIYITTHLNVSQYPCVSVYQCHSAHISLCGMVAKDYKRSVHD